MIAPEKPTSILVFFILEVHSINNRFISHDFEGFEPGEDAKLYKTKRFIEERTQSEMPPEDKLHVIW
jgi:hypothetical protein